MSPHWLPIPGALVSVYTQERRIDTALYATGLPALSEFTIHMWYYGFPHDDDDRSNDWMISVAVPGTPTFYSDFTQTSEGRIFTVSASL